MGTVHEDVDAMLNDTRDEVRSRFDQAKSYADDAMAKLNSVLAGIYNGMGSLNPASVSTVDYNFGDGNVIEVEDPDVDFEAELDAIDSILSGIQSEKKPVRPSITVPNLDDYADIDAINDLKDQVLNGINSMIAVIQSLRSDLGNISFDDTYASDLLDEIKAKIRVLMSTGGESLDEEVFNQNLQHDVQVRQDAIADLLSQAAASGFELPSAFVLANVADLERDWMNKRIELTNQFHMKTLELRHQAVNMAVQSGIEVEKALMDYELRIKQLVLEAKKIVAELVMAVIKSYQELLDAYIKIFQAQVAAFEAAVKGELAKVEIYRADVEAYKATVDAYLKQMDGWLKKLEAEIAVYRAEIEMAKLRGEIRIKELEQLASKTIVSQERALKAQEIVVADGYRKAQILAELKRGLIASFTQLISSCMAAIHVTASISAQGAAQEQFQSSESTQTQTQHVYNH